MAGKFQHHIWQHIQRGFGDLRYHEHHVWVYRRNAPPKRTVTKKHGVEALFYGPVGSVADASITDAEQHLQEFIHELRDAADGEQVSALKASQLVTLLEVRSNFLRVESSKLLERAVKEVESIFSTRKKARSFLSGYIRNHPEFLKEKLAEKGASGEFAEIFSNYLDVFLEQKIEESGDEIFEPLAESLSAMTVIAVEVARDSHIKTLEGELTKLERTALHQSFDYQVVKYPADSLVLPDTGLSFLCKDRIRPFSSKNDVVEEVFVPISADTLLVGSHGGPTIRSEASVQRVLASSSYETFIAKREDFGFKRLSGRIGKNAKLLTDAEVRKALDFSSILN